MKLTQLEYFCVAARYHNITRTSKELFVTQPSVSNAIKALEEEFGVNLFYRNNNKLTLTPEGEKFYQNAEELLAHADAVRSELHELRKQITPVRIGIPPMLGTIYLPDMYLSLKEEFPDVDFRLYEYGSIKACELVLEEKLDLAIVNAEQSAIDEPLVLFNTDSVQVMTLTRQFKAAGVNPHIVLNTSQITTLINMVKTNHIGCFLYKSMVDMYPELVGIPVFPAIEQRIGVIWRKGKYQNAVTEKVIRYLKNY